MLKIIAKVIKYKKKETNKMEFRGSIIKAIVKEERNIPNNFRT